MPTQALEFQFDLAPDNPRVSRFRYARDSVQLMARTMREHGGVIRPVEAAKILQVSRTRAQQLLDEGKLETVNLLDCEGNVLLNGVSLNSVLNYARHVAVDNPTRGPGKKKK